MRVIHYIKRLFSLSPVVIDGGLYVFIALFGAIITCFTSDDVFKYVNVFVVWWVKTIAEICLASVTALKMYRSTQYSDHRDAVNAQHKANDVIPNQANAVPVSQTANVPINTNK